MSVHPIISGAFETRFGALPGSSAMSLHADAARGALADAGLVAADIDAVICGHTLVEPHLMIASMFCEYFGIRPNICFALHAGGAGACAMIAQAVALVSSGMARHVLCVTGDNRLTGLSRDGAVKALSAVGHPQFERPYGFSIPAAYGLVAERYMHEFGVTPEHLAGIAVSARTHAARHPGSHLVTPLTIEEVCSSRIISTPLRLLDCSLISDGGAAVIISAPDSARHLRQPEIRVIGTGSAHTHEHIVAAPSLTDFGCKSSSQQALGRAGLQPSEIDVAEIYDSFTITLLVELESMGFFERGEAGPAISAGALDLGGRLPCNTHGGLLSHGHSGSAGGMSHVVEGVIQLRGQAGDRQVADARHAIIHGDGGILSAHASLVLGRL